MKIKFIITFCFLAIFGLINVREVPVPVRIITYTFIMIPSTLSYVITYCYYASLPEAIQTVLTSAAKSVIVWHMAMSTTMYAQLTIYSLVGHKLGEDNDTIAYQQQLDYNNSRTPTNQSYFPAVGSHMSPELENQTGDSTNQTCFSIPIWNIAGCTFGVAFIEFQLMRVLLEIDPYRLLGMNIELLAFPLAISVPVISGVLSLIVYLDGGSLCDQIQLTMVSRKLNMIVDIQNTLFPRINLRIIQS